MDINLLAIIVILVILIYMVRGFRRGFIKTFASIAVFALTCVLVYFAAPYIRDFIREETPVYEYLVDSSQSLVGMPDEEEMTQEEQADYIEGLELPEILKRQMVDGNTAENYASMAVNNFREYLAGSIADVILTILVYVAGFLLIRLVLGILISALDILSRLPVLHGINKILGLGLGLVQGVFVVWILFLVITIFAGTQGGFQLLRMIEENDILRELYDANVLLNLLL